VYDINLQQQHGSVLGPILFIIYTNDFANCLNNCSSILFADDTTVYITGKDIKELHLKMKNDLCSLSQWFRVNKLSLNISKTKYMLFHNRNSITETEIDDNIRIKIDNMEIKRSNSLKFLGLFIDQNLTWTEHSNYIINKVSKSIYILNCIKNILPQYLKKTLYYSMVYSYFNYGIILWGHTYKFNISKLFIKQKRAIRIINNSEYNAHTDPIFRKFNILKFEDIIKCETLKMMYKAVNHSLPLAINERFILNKEIHNYDTRQTHDIHIAKTTKRVTYNSIIYQGPDMWSELPRELKNITTFNSFKINLKNYIIKNSTVTL